MWMSWPVFRLTRIRVHSTAWTTAKPITSHRPALGSLARDASHAPSRRSEGIRLRLEDAGKVDAVDIAACVARFLRLWNQPGTNNAPGSLAARCRAFLV